MNNSAASVHESFTGDQRSQEDEDQWAFNTLEPSSLPPVYDHYPKAKVQTGTYTLKQDKQPLHQQFEEVLL